MYKVFSARMKIERCKEIKTKDYEGFYRTAEDVMNRFEENRKFKTE